MSEPGGQESREAAIARLTSSVVAGQEARAAGSQARARMTPEEQRAQAAEESIARMRWGSPTTDIEIAKQQAAMERRSRDRRTARSQVRLHGDVDRPQVEEPEEE